MDPTNRDAGCVDRGGRIYSVTGVDRSLSTDAAFRIWSMHDEHDSLEYITIGSVLVYTGSRSGPWRAGRVHADGIHWEERIWVDGEFVAFRDHVASLVEVRLSQREELEQTIANGPIIIRHCRRLQARYDRGSRKYADFEGLIAAARDMIAECRKKLDALQSSSPDTASVAR